MQKRVLAFDLGASSGRAVLGELDENGRLCLTEVHRFSNDPVMLCGTFYWDFLRLMHDVKQGIIKAMHMGGFDSVGIDTWGVDFGLIDKDGMLLENPVHYRDARTDGMADEAFSVLPKEELYRRTGIQTMPFNTVFQLYAIAKKRPHLLEQAETMLLLPDLIAYCLTGVKRAEFTVVSTTQMLGLQSGDWERSLLQKLDIPDRLLPPIIQPGTCYGTLSADICSELGCPAVPVVAVCTHDTASAVVAVPAQGKDFLYISCGTWSLFGTELEQPVLNETHNLTNEGGYQKTVRLLKNIMGLWLLQECKRQWEREGQTVSFAQLAQEAESAAPFVSLIDPDCAMFLPPGDMPERIAQFCRSTGQTVPKSRGEVVRCIYESLSMAYRYYLDLFRQTTGVPYDVIHIIGGGAQADLLCQMTADACGCTVVAGPVEATVTGNVAVQLLSLGQLSGWQQARRVIGQSFEQKKYVPCNKQAYQKPYQTFLQLLNTENKG